MERTIACIRVWTVALIFTLLSNRLAKGDGGIVLLHEAQGPFSVTLFAAPETDRGGLVDVSVLVQWRTNGQVVLDADVNLAVDPPVGSTMSHSDPFCGLPSAVAGFQFLDGRQPTMPGRATRAQASNKLLYATSL